MIWDFMNALIRLAADGIHVVYATLPASPIYLPLTTQTELMPVFGKLAWFFPITGMLTFLGVYLAAVALLAGVLLLKQFIEAIIP